MPMAASRLANSRMLLSIVVPKALLLQTAQLMQGRLGGLIGRQILHLPFSRRTTTDSVTVGAYLDLHKTVMRRSGVAVTIPEHILSFHLSGLQRLSDGRIDEARDMIEAQSWLRNNGRQMLDECDFTLAVRTQLIYPSGPQTTVDGHPHRWEAIQVILSLVEDHIFNLQMRFPHSIEISQRPQGGFPLIFFLRKDAEDELIALLVADVIDGRVSVLQTRELNGPDLDTLRLFLSQTMISKSIMQQLRQIYAQSPAALKIAYLMRGLFVHRILLSTLKKRWNVQYGLHPGRDPIAVPYHAKGVPSEQAEWGHPDISILFTCLAFYFGGLSQSQLRQSLEHIFKSDDPSSVYDRLTQTSETLPGALRNWNVINADDEMQVKVIWEHLRYKVAAIDHYLNQFVYPRHAKQFSVKLQASGWDIPLAQSLKHDERDAATLTTGFSGTNDNRTLLPLTITQEDLPTLAHTNAQVLNHFLQPRNRTYIHLANFRGERLTEMDLLNILNRKHIRVLIDAGAQILEMDNYSLAKAWLSIDTDAVAALFFNTENKAMILYRKGSTMPLLASPYAENLKDCLVYLDEAHTRGTDLKLPVDAKGALTLGVGQTKDHTVQGMFYVLIPSKLN